MRHTAALVVVGVACSAALVGCSSSRHAARITTVVRITTGPKGINVYGGVKGPNNARRRVPRNLSFRRNPRPGAVPSPVEGEEELILLGHSIGGISLDEPQRTVEKAFGPGKSKGRGLVLYFGGRLLVDYWHH